MFCKKCGSALKETDVFCRVCGTKAEPVQQAVNQHTAPSSDNAQKTNKILIITIAALVIILACLVAVIVAGKLSDSKTTVKEQTQNVENPIINNKESQASNKKIKEEKPEIKKPEYGNLNNKLDECITNWSSPGDIAIAIIDNKTGKMYSSQFADTSYVAWGWYLPVYLAYTGQSTYDANIARGIMSSDAGTCNNSANTAIRNFGGPVGMTNAIQANFGVSNTVYGRYFGDTNSVADNYTTPLEAVSFLRYLNQTNNPGLLCYNLSSFGITAPAGATVYGQAGTENRNVRNELNLFAVVKSGKADYCVAIMTRNEAGVHITGLLSVINTEMELRANE